MVVWVEGESFGSEQVAASVVQQEWDFIQDPLDTHTAAHNTFTPSKASAKAKDQPDLANADSEYEDDEDLPDLEEADSDSEDDEDLPDLEDADSDYEDNEEQFHSAAGSDSDASADQHDGEHSTKRGSLESRYRNHAPRVFAEMPRVSHAELDEVRKRDPDHHACLVRLVGMLRAAMWDRQRHNKCLAKRCKRGVGGSILPYCKYGFPQPACDALIELNEAGNRYNYRRRLVSPLHLQRTNTSDAKQCPDNRSVDEECDEQVVPCNLAINLIWGAHTNVQRVTANGWLTYLAKYLSKPSHRFRPSSHVPNPVRYRNTLGSVSSGAWNAAPTYSGTI